MVRKIILKDLPARKGDVDELKQENKKEHNQIMNHLTGLAKMIKDLYEEFAAFNASCKRTESKIDDHEGRIKKLETQILPN